MKEALPDKEFSLIHEIAKSPAYTQRELSQNTGFSLGMTNILLGRLVHKGFVKIKQLDWKRTQYLLTVKGAMEKARKSYAYAVHTIRQFQRIRTRIHEILLAEYSKGTRKAYVIAWPETVVVIEEVLRELPFKDFKIVFLETFKHLGTKKGVVFTATVERKIKPRPGQRIVPLIDYDTLRFRFDDGQGMESP